MIQFDLSKSLHIIPVGRVAIDFNPTDYNRPLNESSNFNKYLGGSPANIAVGMARLGSRVGFLGRVSDDQFGTFVTDYFKNEGIDVSHIFRCEHGEKLGLTFTEMLSPTQSSILMYREGVADLQLCVDDVDEAYIASSACLLISGTALCTSPTREASLKALTFALRNHIPVVFDHKLVQFRELLLGQRKALCKVLQIFFRKTRDPLSVLCLFGMQAQIAQLQFV